jgi:adenosine deaminase
MRGLAATVAVAVLGLAALLGAVLLLGSTFGSDSKPAPARPASAAGPGPAGSPGLNERRTERYLDEARDDPDKLRDFLEAMPKGADLHNHLSGAVPTETLIRLAVQAGSCIDATLATVDPPDGATSCPPGQRRAADSSRDDALYQRLLRGWSMEGFVGGGESGHDHFFATFGKFRGATARTGDLLAAVATINADQNVVYLETLVSRQGAAIAKLGEEVGLDPDFALMRKRLLDHGLARIVRAAREQTDGDMARFDELLGCGTSRPARACSLEVRFDHQVGRAADPEVVFANLALGFELQRRDRRFVGVNLVQPEDNPVALRDYALQMRMIRYLRGVYPRAHVTLHAGELVPGLVDPADLRSHIRQAVQIAGAQRIGHGVSLASERDPRGLLRAMAARHVLVEVPLTSNAQILGVSGKAHPLRRYMKAGVPVALATDDPGVSRIDITHEYEVAVTDQHLRYRDLKKLSRASLEHAFLPGRSLWRAPDVPRRRAACARDVPGAGTPARACRALLRASAKARAQWELETRLRAFEQQPR